MTTRRVRVPLGERSYDIVIGGGLLEMSGEILRNVLREPRCIVITDEHVAAHHVQPLQAVLTASEIEYDVIVLPTGEQTKSFTQLESLLNELLNHRPERSTTVIAVGGGVVGDIAGVAASLLLRGVDFVQVPTTLLAQVDSSVGGKTGINTEQGKNLVGSFYQPRLVLADVATLETLPRRELLAGYAEVVKYGLIDDANFFTWLEGNGEALIAGDRDRRVHAVETGCAAKARIVGADERESDQRALLNLGHTFAHAFESAAGYDGSLLHGEAVAIGCCLAFDLSGRLGLSPAQDAARVRNHYAAVGLPTRLPATARLWSSQALLDSMTRDKKARAGRPVFILARGIGQAFVASDVPRDPVAQLLDEAIQNATSGG